MSRLRSRERAAARLRAANRTLLAAILLLLALFFAAGYLGEDLRSRLPMSGLQLALVAAAVVSGAVLVVVTIASLRRRPLEAIARRADQELGLLDLLASGWSARGETEVERVVVRRSARAAAAVDPEKWVPLRPRVVKVSAFVLAALLAAYLLDLSSGAGMLPLGVAAGGQGETRTSSRGPSRPPAGTHARLSPLSREKRKPPKGEARSAPAPKKKAPAKAQAAYRVLVHLDPMKDVYHVESPIPVFVGAEPGRSMNRAHSLHLILSLDGKVARTGRSIVVKPGPNGGNGLTVDLENVPSFLTKLTPGSHTVQATLTGDGRSFSSDLRKIRIEGEPGKSSSSKKPKPKPRPKPRIPKPRPEPHRRGGLPPPAPAPEAAHPRYVRPLFRSGKKEEKTGYALVPDPRAPAGTPPRRLPVEEAARRVGKQRETPVPTERVAPSDRDLVRRYFHRLKEGK